MGTDHPSPRLLVVDDDRETTVTFAGLLRLEGYDVVTAIDGDDAVMLATHAQFDGIILDLRMPVVDGLAVLRSLRASATNGTTPVAIVTGNYLIDGEEMTALQELGASVHFKPLW